MSYEAATQGKLSQMIAQIRDALTQPDRWDTNRLEELATRFAETTRALFSRLDQCLALIREGQRSEALRLADMPPPLLELLQIVTVPEYNNWRVLCDGFGFPVPPPFPEEALSDLNEAYSKARRVDALLRMLRVMSIRGVPLAERLPVLRRLVQLEPDNVAWRQDLEQWEKARLEEITTGLQSPSNRRDVALLANWVHELTPQNWTIPIPPDLLRAVQTTYQQAVRDQALQELRELAQSLHQAYTALDLATARKLRAQWDTLLKLAAPRPDDPAWSHAGPALQWVEEQDRIARAEAARQKAVANLQKALERKVSSQYLERLHAQATEGGTELPVELERRYQIALETARSAEMRRRRLLYALAFAVIVGPSLALTTFLWFAHAEKTKSLRISNLREFIHSGDVEKAEAYLAEIRKSSPKLYAHPEIQKLKFELEDLRRREANRKRELQALLAEVENALAGEVSDEIVNRLYGILEKAKELARSENQSQVLELEDKVRRRDLELQKIAQEIFSQELETFEIRLSEAEQSSRDSVSPNPVELEGLKEQFQELKRRAPKQFQSALEVFELRLQKLEAELNRKGNAKP